MILVCLIPPVLWVVALHRYFKDVLGLPGNLPVILTAFGTLWYGTVVSGIPINQYQIAFSGWLFAIVEPVLVYLSAEAYWRRRMAVPNADAT
jgi:hypothetical protein